MNDADRIALLTSYQSVDSGDYCHFAGGRCSANNTADCPTKSVLKHCNVLREHYQGHTLDDELKYEPTPG